MQPRVRLSGFAILAILQLSCAGSPRSAQIAPDSPVGTFQFSDRARESGVVIDIVGEFTIGHDTLTATLANRRCRPLVPPDLRRFVVDCGDVTLSFDRIEPLRRPSYRAVGTVMVDERVCREYVQDRFGVQRCAGYLTQRVPRERSFLGELHPRPVP